MDDRERHCDTSSTKLARSPDSVRRAKSRPAPEADSGVRVNVFDETYESVISAGSVFKNEVRTRLEYVEIVREMGTQCNGVMIDDQRVILVSVSAAVNVIYHFALAEPHTCIPAKRRLQGVEHRLQIQTDHPSADLDSQSMTQEMTVLCM
jgi:hypothetical protein